MGMKLDVMYTVVWLVPVIRRYFLDIKNKQLSQQSCRHRSRPAAFVRTAHARSNPSKHCHYKHVTLLLRKSRNTATPDTDSIVHKNHSKPIQLKTNALFRSKRAHDEKRKHLPICLSLQIPNNIKNCHSQVRTQNTDLFTSWHLTWYKYIELSQLYFTIKTSG